MSRQLAAGLTVIFLLALLVANPPLSGIPFYEDPSLRAFWLKNIAMAMPPAFTLGMCTVLLYKAFRYPRGTVFTILGLLQIVFVGWLIWLTFQAGVIWVSLPILLVAAFVGPKSAKATWRWLGVDRYYRIKAETDAG